MEKFDWEPKTVLTMKCALFDPNLFIGESKMYTHDIHIHLCRA